MMAIREINTTQTRYAVLKTDVHHEEPINNGKELTFRQAAAGQSYYAPVSYTTYDATDRRTPGSRKTVCYSRIIKPVLNRRSISSGELT